MREYARAFMNWTRTAIHKGPPRRKGLAGMPPNMIREIAAKLPTNDRKALAQALSNMNERELSHIVRLLYIDGMHNNFMKEASSLLKRQKKLLAKIEATQHAQNA
jgi:hypothetical protein